MKFTITLGKEKRLCNNDASLEVTVDRIVLLIECWTDEPGIPGVITIIKMVKRDDFEQVEE